MPSPIRDELLDAVSRVLDADGPTGVTTKRIAAEAGCSEGSIYNHFATKDDLLACALSERVAAFPAILGALEDEAGGEPVEARLAEVATQAIVFYRRMAASIAVGLCDPERFNEQARRIHAAGHGPWRKLEALARWLERERELGTVRPDADPDAAATALLGACMFHAMTTRAWGADLGPDDATGVRRAVHAVWLGLAPVTDPARDSAADS